MFNKVVNINYITTKFATGVPHSCMVMDRNGPHLPKLH